MKFISILLLSVFLSISACSDQKTTEEYIEQGENFYAKKEWKSAIIELKNAIKQSPESGKARALLGKTYLKTLSINAAIKELTRALQLKYERNEIIPALAKAYTLNNENQKIIDEITVEQSQPNQLKADIFAFRSSAYFRLGDEKAAKEALDKAKELDDTSTDVRLAWANYEKAMGRIGQQLSWLEPLLEREGGVADAWSMKAEIQNKEQNYEAAEKSYSRAIELRQYVHIDYLRRALIRITTKNYQGAQQDIDYLKKAGANWPGVGHTDGLIAFHNEEFDIAQSRFQDVLSRAPDYAPTQYMLALIDLDNKNFNNAVSLLEQYTAVNPHDYQANILFSEALIKTSQFDKAISLLTRLRKQDPDDHRALLQLGQIYVLQKKNAQAIGVLDKAIQLKPDIAALHMLLGNILIKDELTLGKGRQALMKAIQLDPELVNAKVVLFQSFLNAKKFEDARDMAKQIVEDVKDSSNGGNLLASTYLAEGKTKLAIDSLKNTLVRFPNDFLTSHNLARIYINENQIEKARSLYENVLKEDPSNLTVLNQLAVLAARDGDQDKLIDWLKKAEKRNPQQVSAKLLLASQYLKQNNPRDAVQVLTNVREPDDRLPAYKLLMAQAKLGVNEHQHAIRALKSLATTNPEITSAHVLLAHAYGLQNQPVKVRESLDMALLSSPENIMVNVMLARLDLLEGKIDDFNKRVNALEKKYPDNSDVQFLKAKVLSGGGNYSSAINSLSEIMKQAPHSAVVIDLSKNQWRSGKREVAITNLELWTEDHADDKRALMLLAQYYLVDDREEEARETYLKLESLIPDNPLVLNNLAWLLLETDPEQGIVYATKAMKQNPEDPLVKDTLAMLYLRTDDKEKALQYSKEALEILPANVELRFNHARILKALNQNDKAREILQDLLQSTEAKNREKEIKEELDSL